jgi:hypothetical protein
VRPARDASGNPKVDANGNQQFETAELSQNSGISVVVPAQFVQDALDQAEGKAAKVKTSSPIVIEGNQVINTVPDTAPKIASSLSNAELKRQTGSFLERFRIFISQQQARESDAALALAVPGAVPGPFLAVQQQGRQEYQKTFETEAKQLRDDFWARLPIEARKSNSVELYDYGDYLPGVASDLERLSKMLPD